VRRLCDETLFYCSEVLPRIKCRNLGLALERETVVSASCLIAQNMCGSVIRSDDGIDAAVVVHVPDGHSAGNPRLVKDGARLGGDVDKTCTCS
jgi:hypothetical protein